MFGGEAKTVQCSMLARIFEDLSSSVADALGEAIGAPGGDAQHVCGVKFCINHGVYMYIYICICIHRYFSIYRCLLLASECYKNIIVFMFIICMCILMFFTCVCIYKFMKHVLMLNDDQHLSLCIVIYIYATFISLLAPQVPADSLSQLLAIYKETSGFAVTVSSMLRGDGMHQ